MRALPNPTAMLSMKPLTRLSISDQSLAGTLELSSSANTTSNVTVCVHRTTQSVFFFRKLCTNKYQIRLIIHKVIQKLKREAEWNVFCCWDQCISPFYAAGNNAAYRSYTYFTCKVDRFLFSRCQVFSLKKLCAKKYQNWLSFHAVIQTIKEDDEGRTLWGKHGTAPIFRVMQYRLQLRRDCDLTAARLACDSHWTNATTHGSRIAVALPL